MILLLPAAGLTRGFTRSMSHELWSGQFLFRVEDERDSGTKPVRVKALIAVAERSFKFSTLLDLLLFRTDYDWAVQVEQVTIGIKQASKKTGTLVIAQIPGQRPVFGRGNRDWSFHLRPGAFRQPVNLIHHREQIAVAVRINIRILIVVIMIEVEDDRLRAGNGERGGGERQG